MKRSTRSLLLPALLAVLLGAGVWLQLRHEDALAIDPLTTIDAAAVQRVAVDCKGCIARRFEKRAGHWWMLAPEDRAADDAALARLVAIAASPVRLRHPRGELDPARLGLAPPQATLQLDDRVLRFGTTDALNGDRYVEVDGAVALVPDRFSARLYAKPDSELAAPAGKD